MIYHQALTHRDTFNQTLIKGSKIRRTIAKGLIMIILT